MFTHTYGASLSFFFFLFASEQTLLKDLTAVINAESVFDSLSFLPLSPSHVNVSKIDARSSLAPPPFFFLKKKTPPLLLQAGVRLVRIRRRSHEGPFIKHTAPCQAVTHGE